MTEREVLDYVDAWRRAAKNHGLVLDTPGQAGCARMDISGIEPTCIDYIHWIRRKADGHTIDYEILLDPEKIKEVKVSGDGRELLMIAEDGANFRFKEHAT